MRRNYTLFTICALCALSVTPSHAGVSNLNTSTSIRPVSQYGLIQNVQDYSSNPFWNKNSPYNLNFPQPVYVTGPDLDSGDCLSTVGALVSSYCSANNNCVGMMLSDVRPIIMVQLARLPGHNYATICAGYIDSEFNKYVEKYSVAVPNGTVAFPGATVANPNYNADEFKIENPYERKDGTWNGEEWQRERKERIQELKDLQAQNGGGSESIVKSDFPTTFSDLSFSERVDVKTAGYEPWAEADAYVPISIESEEDYITRKQQEHDLYCKQNPNDASCPQQVVVNNGTGGGIGDGTSDSESDPDEIVLNLT